MPLPLFHARFCTAIHICGNFNPPEFRWQVRDERQRDTKLEPRQDADGFHIRQSAVFSPA
jgi:hypothetical protein